MQGFSVGVDENRHYFLSYQVCVYDFAPYTGSSA